jgi:putative thioredoxin
MLDISLTNFETDVIDASMQQPVLLDLWAPWCGPCKALGPVLEKLETAYAGRFRLAKLNSDEQPEIAGQLSQMFGVRSIPFCVLFKEGQPVDGFVGALPEGEVRKFLDKHVPTAAAAAAQEEVQAAAEMLAEGDADQAIERLQEALAINPGDDTARYEYVRALLMAGRAREARAAFEPVAAKVALDARFAACQHWLAACEVAESGRSVEQLTAAVEADRRDFDARFELAQHAFARQQFTQAMDELLEILTRDKGWRDGLARKTYVAVLEVMGKASAPPASDPGKPRSVVLEIADGRVKESTTDTYRRRLSMVLF